LISSLAADLRSSNISFLVEEPDSPFFVRIIEYYNGRGYHEKLHNSNGGHIGDGVRLS
jgi:hypothetical protein